MYTIISKQYLTPLIVEMQVYAPLLASAALPGQFLIVEAQAASERIPLTVCDTDASKGTVTIVYQVVGASTAEMAAYNVGDSFAHVAGPLGNASDMVHMSKEELSRKHILFVAGGVGTAPVYPQVKYLHTMGVQADVIIGAKNKDMLIYADNMRKVAGHVYVVTDDGSEGEKGFVTTMLQKLVEEQHKHYDMVVAIGPMIMMKNVAAYTKRYNIPTIVSLNSIMVDGTGMCGACRVKVGEATQFTCFHGPEFNAFDIDFDEAMKRQAMYAVPHSRSLLEQQEDMEHHECYVGGVTREQPDRMHRVPIREQHPAERARNFDEVCLGYTEEEAVMEAKRCLQCKQPKCVQGCTVNIHIPRFVAQVAAGNFEEAARVIARSSLLPAVCGRVCPQEVQCEGQCVLGIKGEPLAIGKLERFVADWNREHVAPSAPAIASNGKKVAIVGSGPAGLTCAADLAQMGYEVTIYEALHEFGGVLRYGIPEFRLPKEKIVDAEIENIKRLGVHMESDVVIGRTLTIHHLMQEQHYKAVFVASGAGLPKFMHLPGENYNGVVSANEFLTRNNLMKSFLPHYNTPNYIGHKVVVVGGGNVAVDAARTALRLGADVTMVYRRSKAEMPARVEEIHHAEQEGVKLLLLTNPVEFIGDSNYWVKQVKVQKMQLNNVDSSGRRSVSPIEGSEYILDADMVIIAVGTSPNPLIADTTPQIEVNAHGCIVANAVGQTSMPGVFAGGDAVSGAATVILAMGAGRAAAKAIHEYLS